MSKLIDDRIALIWQYAAGIATEMLYTVFIAIIAIIISALALRWL